MAVNDKISKAIDEIISNKEEESEKEEYKIIKKVLTPDQYEFFMFIEKIQERTIKRMIEFLKLIETQRMIQIQALASALAEQMKKEEKSQLRRNLEDIIAIINTIMPFIKQKPKLEVK